ncbi:MAG: hypothetical protein GX442_05305, partial [Candidatus Riflebacteria bacterium]|nr:hypothetical protein [Candidatus Riflebacteria bacterium]
DPGLMLNARSAFFKRLFFSPQDPDAVNLTLRPDDQPRLLEVAEQFLLAVTPDASTAGDAPPPARSTARAEGPWERDA